MPTEERSAEVPISESDLVEIIRRRVREGNFLGTDEVGVGDDAAVVRFDSQRLVLTADAMVEVCTFFQIQCHGTTLVGNVLFRIRAISRRWARRQSMQF